MTAKGGQEKVRVFIGSGEASLLERKTVIHSLRKHSKRDLDIYVFNGTHNAVELNDGKPFPAPMSLRVKYLNITEFSLYRFLIPELCDHKGRAIWIDSDTVCLADIGDLFDAPMGEYDFLAKKEAYRGPGNRWGLSVMLIDCERARFDLEKVADEIENGDYTYGDFAGMSAKYLKQHSCNIGPLDPQWNVFDFYDRNTKLIHYTNLYTQPWKYPNHLYGDLWYQYFREAIASGYISQNDIETTKVRSYVRTNIMNGNFTFLGREFSVLKDAASKGRRILKKLIIEPRDSR